MGRAGPVNNITTGWFTQGNEEVRAYSQSFIEPRREPPPRCGTTVAGLLNGIGGATAPADVL